jgi:2-methylcitrate dehydratase PrpD
MTVIEELAGLVAGTTAIPETAAEAGRRSIADLMTSAIAGSVTLGGSSARRAAKVIFGAGPAPLWFAGESLTVAGAAFANAASACMLDLDDGHRAAAGHPGAAVIPAVLAEAARAPQPLPRLLAAIAVGYEVGVRVSRARDFTRLDSTATGRWSGVGAAAALGWLRGTPRPALTRALGIAAAHAPNLARIGVRAEAGHVKEGIPWANASGVAALDLAEAGHTGSLDAYDDPARHDRGAILQGWGQPWLIEGTYYKPYSCCRWAHAALDGLAAMLAEEPVAPEAIEAIELDLFSRALTLNNLVRPPSMEAAQYSIPYVLGMFAVHGAGVLQPMRPDCLDDVRAMAVASRVVMRVDPRFDAMFPAASPCRITLVAGGRRRVREVLQPRGEPGNPMDWAALRAKQRTVCRELLTEAAIERLWSAIETMRAGDIAPLLALLAAPLAAPPELVAG